MVQPSRFGIAVLSLIVTAGLTGCSLTGTAPSSPVAGPAIKGSVHGGQQPVTGAHVYLYAANTLGYNTTAATYSSVSLLQAASNTTIDSSGNYYVTTDATGGFSIGGDYTCVPDGPTGPGQQVYMYAVGGNSGFGTSTSTNSSIGLMAVLGDCPSTGNFATATPIVQMNEVTTVAAAYAMAGFAYDATHVSSSSTVLARTGVENAFANASNLASLSTGLALTATPAANGGNGIVPQTTINTLANILAACINSDGTVSGPVNSGPNPTATPTPCYTLFYSAESAGSTGTLPTDTATAAINIAHNPGANVAALYNLPSATAPFMPTLGAQPNDFTLGIAFTGGGLGNPRGIAVDASGNLWVANTNGSANGNAVVKLSSTGAVLSGTGGFTAGTIYLPVGIAIDRSGDAWVTNYTGDSVTELSSSGVLLSSGGTGPFTGGGLKHPWAIAIDGPGNVWVANDSSPAAVTKISSSGSFLSGANGYTGGGMSGLLGIALDGSGNAWLANGSSSPSIVELSSTGGVLSGLNGYTSSGFTLPSSVALDGTGNVWVPSQSLFELSNSGSFLSPSGGNTAGGIRSPYYGVALDGSGNVWVANYTSSVSEYTKSGTAITSSNGYTGGQQGFGWGIAIDGSGDTWVADYDKGTITELIGAATPVITPICAGLPVTPTVGGISSLGTRP